MVIKALGLTVALLIALAKAAVVLILELNTFCLNPALQRCLKSITFWPKTPCLSLGNLNKCLVKYQPSLQLQLLYREVL